MNADKQTLNTITGLIYLELFGLTRAKLLEQAKQRPDYGLMAGELYEASDEDECLRDCLNVEALTALSEVEGELARLGRVTEFRGNLSQRTQQIARLAVEVCERVKAKYELASIWYKEGE
jgi:hypothetical protein